MADIIRVDFRGADGPIPQRTLAQLNAYTQKRRPVGGFLTAVLSNDLQLAVTLADRDNLRALKPICQYVYNQLPGDCWGSLEAVEQYLKEKVRD